MCKPPRGGEAQESPPDMPGWWHFATGDGTPRSSLKVALVVGAILTAINQGDVILAGNAPNILKAGLTFAVPYLVATYGAVMAKRAGWRARQASAARK